MCVGEGGGGSIKMLKSLSLSHSLFLTRQILLAEETEESLPPLAVMTAVVMVTQG